MVSEFEGIYNQSTRFYEVGIDVDNVQIGKTLTSHAVGLKYATKNTIRKRELIDIENANDTGITCNFINCIVYLFVCTYCLYLRSDIRPYQCMKYSNYQYLQKLSLTQDI